MLYLKSNQPKKFAEIRENGEDLPSEMLENSAQMIGFSRTIESLANLDESSIVKETD